jgi:hypothetical protein
MSFACFMPAAACRAVKANGTGLLALPCRVSVGKVIAGSSAAVRAVYGRHLAT